jgi:hypothetical protein
VNRNRNGAFLGKRSAILSITRRFSPDISPVLQVLALRAALAPCKIKLFKKLFDFARKQDHVDPGEPGYHKFHLVAIASTAEITSAIRWGQGALRAEYDRLKKTDTTVFDRCHAIDFGYNR